MYKYLMHAQTLSTTLNQNKEINYKSEVISKRHYNMEVYTAANYLLTQSNILPHLYTLFTK